MAGSVQHVHMAAANGLVVVPMLCCLWCVVGWVCLCCDLKVIGRTTMYLMLWSLEHLIFYFP